MTDAATVSTIIGRITATNWLGQLQQGQSGPVPNLVNAELFLENHPLTAGKLKLNLFKGEFEYDGRPLADLDITTFRFTFEHDRVSFSEQTMSAVVDMVAQKHAYHPIQDYLTGLVWDGTPRIDRLFTDYFQSAPDDPHRKLYAEIGRRFILGAVARVCRPGCKLDTYPVLEGRWGLGKSSGIKALVGDPRWFSDTKIELDSKDGMQSLSGNWILEVAELDSFKGANSNRLKSFVSSATDKYRPAYGKRVVTIPRQCVFLATTNETDYVSDATGERRKQPVALVAVDRDAITRDRDQLWAEAYAAYKSGERWWLDSEDEARTVEIAATRQQVDPWEEELVPEIVRDIRERGLDDRIDGQLYVASAKLRAAFGLDGGRAKHQDTARMARVLKRLGCVNLGSCYVKQIGHTVRIWSVPEHLWQQQQEHQ